MHNTTYEQLYEKCLKIVKKKKSTKAQTICEYQYKSRAKEVGDLDFGVMSADGGIKTAYASSKI